MRKIMNGNKLAKEDILYEDDSIAVCRKQAGIATQTARLGELDLESALKNYWKASYVAVVHRLDQPVEGVLVFARTTESAARLSRQSAGQIMNKKYYAVVMADASMEAGKENTLVDYLRKRGKENISEVVDKNTKDAKRAELVYEVVAVKEILLENGNNIGIAGGHVTANKLYNGIPSDKMWPGAVERDAGFRKQIALLRIQLKTGRHHQIRVQMAHGGMPLLGDGKYGSMESKGYSHRMCIKNIALCAYGLEFVHPVTGEKMNFEITPEGEAFTHFPVNS